MVSRNVRTVLLAVVLAGAVALSGCAGLDSGGNETDADAPNGTNESQSVAETFENRMTDLDSYRATLRTTISLNGSETTIVSNVWARPATGEFRSEIVSAPFNEGQIVVGNESAVAVYDPRTGEVTRTESGSPQAASGVPQVGTLANDSTITYNGTAQLDGEETYRVRLEPNRSMGGQDLNITAWLDTETYFPTQVQIQSDSPQGEFTSVVEFEDVELDAEIPDSRFTLDAAGNATTESGAGNTSTANETA